MPSRQSEANYDPHAPTILITGTGRSGTGYISRVLTEAGVICGHEMWWNPQGKQSPRLMADASWVALSRGLGNWSGHVFHQVRHPLRVIASMESEISRKYRVHPYWEERRKLFTESDDVFEDSVACYLAFFDAAERVAEKTWRLEDVDAHLIAELRCVAGLKPDRKTVVAALDKVPRNVNDHNHNRTVSFDELPDRYQGRVAEIAARFNYQM